MNIYTRMQILELRDVLTTAARYLLDECGHDVLRVAVLCGVVWLSTLALQHGWFGVTGYDTLSFNAASFVLVVILAHVLRRLLVPRLGLQRLVRIAEASPVAAALVYAATLLFMLGVAGLQVWLLK